RPASPTLKSPSTELARLSRRGRVLIKGISHHSPEILLLNFFFASEGSLLGVSSTMTYVVNESCIRCKYTDCVEVCPVDCFYEGENLLVIHPEECIDCGVGEPECPVDAIKPDTEQNLKKWLALNRQYSQVWPVITKKKPAPPDADAFKNVP